jgi:hypothetical protein
VLDGSDDRPFDPDAATNAIASTIGNAAQNDRPWFINDQQMKVVKVAICPCAKLMARVARR